MYSYVSDCIFCDSNRFETFQILITLHRTQIIYTT